MWIRRPAVQRYEKESRSGSSCGMQAARLGCRPQGWDAGRKAGMQAVRLGCRPPGRWHHNLAAGSRNQSVPAGCGPADASGEDFPFHVHGRAEKLSLNTAVAPEGSETHRCRRVHTAA